VGRATKRRTGSTKSKAGTGRSSATRHSLKAAGLSRRHAHVAARGKRARARRDAKG